jgi:hypothetical protein
MIAGNGLTRVRFGCMRSWNCAMRARNGFIITGFGPMKCWNGCIMGGKRPIIVRKRPVYPDSSRYGGCTKGLVV